MIYTFIIASILLQSFYEGLKIQVCANSAEDAWECIKKLFDFEKIGYNLSFTLIDGDSYVTKHPMRILVKKSCPLGLSEFPFRKEDSHYDRLTPDEAWKELDYTWIVEDLGLHCGRTNQGNSLWSCEYDLCVKCGYECPNSIFNLLEKCRKCKYYKEEVSKTTYCSHSNDITRSCTLREFYGDEPVKMTVFASSSDELREMFGQDAEIQVLNGPNPESTSEWFRGNDGSDIFSSNLEENPEDYEEDVEYGGFFHDGQTGYFPDEDSIEEEYLYEDDDFFDDDDDQAGYFSDEDPSPIEEESLYEDDDSYDDV